VALASSEYPYVSVVAGAVECKNPTAYHPDVLMVRVVLSPVYIVVAALTLLTVAEPMVDVPESVPVAPMEVIWNSDTVTLLSVGSASVRTHARNFTVKDVPPDPGARSGTLM
jgi:hypothetical protein